MRGEGGRDIDEQAGGAWRTVRVLAAVLLLSPTLTVVRALLLSAACWALFEMVVNRLGLGPSGWRYLLAAAPVALIWIWSLAWNPGPIGFARRLVRKGKYADAFAIFSFGANYGDPEAFINLGDMFREGLGVARDPSRAAGWYARALDVFAAWRSASAGGVELPERLLEVIRSLDGRDDPTIRELRAKAFLAMGRPEEALGVIRSFPQGEGGPGGQADALVHGQGSVSGSALAGLIRFGDGLAPASRDSEKAKRVGVRCGLPTNPFMTLVFLFGGIIASIAAAVILEKRNDGELGGYTPVCFFLALLFALALCVYVSRDWIGMGGLSLKARLPGLAAQFFTRGCRAGDPRSAKRLGDLYRDGIGVERDDGKAIAAYGLAREFLQAHREREKSGVMKPGERVVTGNEAVALRRGLRDALAALADVGAPGALAALVTVCEELGEGDTAIRYARRNAIGEPSFADGIAGALLLLRYAREGDSDFADGLDSLRRLAAKDVFGAKVALTLVLGKGATGKGGVDDPALAVDSLRDALSLFDRLPAEKRPAAGREARAAALRLIEWYGPDCLAEDDRLAILRTCL